MDFITNVPIMKIQREDKLLYPFNPPIFQTEVDQNFTKELIEKGRKLSLKDDDWNHHLAGNLKYGRSYHYKQDFVKKAEKYLMNYVERYFNGLFEQFGNDYNGVKRLVKLKKRGTRR